VPRTEAHAAKCLLEKPGTPEEMKARQIRANRISDMEYEHRKWKSLTALRTRIEKLKAEQNSEIVRFDRVWDRRLEELREKVEGEKGEDVRAKTMKTMTRPLSKSMVPKRDRFAQSAPISRRPRSVVVGIL
jgi:hypothetical protein